MLPAELQFSELTRSQMLMCDSTHNLKWCVYVCECMCVYDQAKKAQALSIASLFSPLSCVPPRKTGNGPELPGW